MKARDFSYNDRTLSSFGFSICRFDSSGIETVNGVEITFNTIPVLNGNKYMLVSKQYENCLESVIQICKYSCSKGIEEITPVEHREIIRWLSQKKFLKFKLFDNEHIDLYYNVAFTNISRIELDGKLIGLELNLITDSPFAIKEPRTIVIKNLVKDGKHSVHDTSHEEGYIYPHTQIEIIEDGDLDIYNALEDRNVVVKNCKAGEIITMDYPVITTTDESHKLNIQNDFNWNFFRIANTYRNSSNDFTISIPCTIKFAYSPVVKVGL